MTTDIRTPVTRGGRRTISRIATGLPLVAAAALLPLLPTAPAYAVDHVICVGKPAGPCDETTASIKAAILVADANQTPDTIFVGPGTYTDGPYYLHGGLTLKGSGQGATTLTLPDLAGADEYVEVNGAALQDLTIRMSAVPMTSNTGLTLYNQATAMAVTVDGIGTQSVTGIKAANSAIWMSTVQMGTGVNNHGISSGGGTTVNDSAITGWNAFVHSGANTTDLLSRVSLKAWGSGVWTDSGTVNLDDAVVDLGSGPGSALLAANYDTSTAAKTINANHVTVVGGGAGSKGAYAYAGEHDSLQVSTIQLSNSIVRGPTKSLAVWAGNDGTRGGPSTATIMTSYSNWSTTFVDNRPHGSAQVMQGPGNVDVDPAFVNAAGGDYRLQPGSPVADHGDPNFAGPTLDLDGKTRVVDGDGNGTSVRDMGAYELQVAPSSGTPAPGSGTPAPVTPAPDTVAPQTKFTSKPAKTVTKRTVRFRFKADEAGVTYQCKLDKKAWRSCTSPKKIRVKVGKHRFKVRATDAAGNTDPTPASYRFKRVSVAS